MEKTNIPIDFEESNADVIRSILDEQLRQGRVLKKINHITGMMTFVPSENTAVYALPVRFEYEDGLHMHESWIRCGELGIYTVYRFDGKRKNAPPIPEKTRELDKYMSSRLALFCILGIIEFVIMVIMSCDLINAVINSPCGYAANFSSENVTEIIGTLMVVIACADNALSKIRLKKAMKDSRRSRSKWVKNYILTTIFAVLLMGAFLFLVFGHSSKKQSITLPDERLPYSEYFDKCTLKKSLTADIYTYGDCFLAETRKEGLSAEMFDEIKEKKNDCIKLLADYRLFGYYDVYTEINTDRFPAIDRAIICSDSGENELTHSGIIILSGNKLFGSRYDHMQFSEEDVLMRINDFFS